MDIDRCLVGCCPGPAATVLLTGRPKALAFRVSMIAGMDISDTLEVGTPARTAAPVHWLRGAQQVGQQACPHCCTASEPVLKAGVA